MPLTIQDLWKASDFKPNPEQERAICEVKGPTFLTAGPGSGKTRVLLWRAVNLITFHDISPSAVFLSTFTEKAARQLKQGLQVYVGLASNMTGRSFDLSPMYVGTLHSLCQRILLDRRLSIDGKRGNLPTLLDALQQYFFLYDKRKWNAILEASGLSLSEVNLYFGNTRGSGQASTSRHVAVQSSISFFNRLSEEDFGAEETNVRDKTLKKLLKGYSAYKQLLLESPLKIDLSLLQQAAYKRVSVLKAQDLPFEHVIVDEYQDTNAIQEKLIFSLSQRSKNLCVVGDDDQALYRFRGATVENFVQFPARCKRALKLSATRIPLEVNYRSRKQIVDFYGAFMKTCDWSSKVGTHRVSDKKVTPFSADEGGAVFVTDRFKTNEDVCADIAKCVVKLVEQGRVKDPNQVAFLFPSLGSVTAVRMRNALTTEGLKVFAPRASRFLETEEAKLCIGLLLKVFGRPTFEGFGRDATAFEAWLDDCGDSVKEVVRHDTQLHRFLLLKQQELTKSVNEFMILEATAIDSGWGLVQEFVPRLMQARLANSGGLGQKAESRLRSKYLTDLAERRHAGGHPLSLKYVLTSATSVDWSILDLFYQLSGFGCIKGLLDLAQTGKDEGPAYNLAEFSRYLARFIDDRGGVLSPSFISQGKFAATLFSSYFFALFRLGETEFEDQENPFPKGRVPFLTIHQAKGLEFPVVVLGNPRKDNNGPSKVESVIRTIMSKDGEPIERSTEFDIMRMFYVALSRPKNLLILVDCKHCQVHPGLREVLSLIARPLKELKVNLIPIESQSSSEELPKPYSYTADYSLYEKCGRQYMIFRRFGFVPSRSQTQFFGSLVHKTIEDLHHLLIRKRKMGVADAR